MSDDDCTCPTCSRPLDVHSGEAFLTDDGRIYCADHFPQEP